MGGPLEGIRVIELAAIGPTPFAGMMLADAGVEIIRIERVDGTDSSMIAAGHELLQRGRRSIAVNLKHPAGVEFVLDLVQRADGLIEGFRPGVAERLGIGPTECLARNSKLVYGRMTGWGQDGPLAGTAGHDINYIALSGILDAIGRADDHPVPPINLIADFGGGGMLLAFGMVAGIIHAIKTGIGQVVDAAMVDGSALLMTMIYGMRAKGEWSNLRGTNLLDTGAHFYEVYETADGGFVAVGAIEAKFYQELLRLLELDQSKLPPQLSRDSWPEMKQMFAAIFLGKTRSEWERIFSGSDACVTPVLTTQEALMNSQLMHRKTFRTVHSVVQPSPAPRFSVTPSVVDDGTARGHETESDVFADWHVDGQVLSKLRQAGVIR